MATVDVKGLIGFWTFEGIYEYDCCVGGVRRGEIYDENWRED